MKPIFANVVKLFCVPLALISRSINRGHVQLRCPRGALLSHSESLRDTQVILLVSHPFYHFPCLSLSLMVAFPGSTIEIRFTWTLKATAPGTDGSNGNIHRTHINSWKRCCDLSPPIYQVFPSSYNLAVLVELAYFKIRVISSGLEEYTIHTVKRNVHAFTVLIRVWSEWYWRVDRFRLARLLMIQMTAGYRMR